MEAIFKENLEKIVEELINIINLPLEGISKIPDLTPFIIHQLFEND